MFVFKNRSTVMSSSIQNNGDKNCQRKVQLFVECFFDKENKNIDFLCRKQSLFGMSLVQTQKCFAL